MKEDELSGCACLGVSVVIVIMIILMALSSQMCAGQGAVYLLHQPADLGVGSRVDYYPLRTRDKDPGPFGFYNSLTYGNWGLYRVNNLDHHIKFSSGVLIPFGSTEIPYMSMSIGVNYHHLGKGTVVDPGLGKVLYRRWSYEVGWTARLKRLSVCVATDIPRWEPCVGFGLSF